MKEVRLIVTGRVQGVFFRHNTRKKAYYLGLTGFVRNLPDGSVEVVAQGVDEKLKILAEFCRRGPAFARVDGVSVEYRDVKEKYKDFSILY